MPTPQEIVTGIDKLASLPAVYVRVQRILDDPGGSIGALAQALSTDTAMTARVLQVVNSPFYGFPGRIQTVSRALNILGMQQVHDLVLAWAISSALAGLRPHGISMEAFWRKSTLRAIAARYLGRRRGFLDAERLFVEGLLSDIGHLVMYCRIPELAAKAHAESERSKRPAYEVEREIVGCDYAEVGAALVRAWSLPEAFEEPIARQIEPSAARLHGVEAAILHVAGIMAESGSEPDAPLGRDQLDPFALENLDLDESSLTELRQRSTAELDAVVATFFPHLRSAA